MVLAGACGGSPAKSSDAQPAAAAKPATGGSSSTSGPAATDSASSSSPDPTSTSTTVVTSRALEDAQDACRAFVSFAGILAGVPEDGQDASGQVGGVLVSAGYAVDSGGGAARWTKLDHDLKAVQAVTTSSRWPLSMAAARLPQIAVVQSDCKSIGTG